MFFASTRIMKNPFGFSSLFSKKKAGRSHKRVASHFAPREQLGRHVYLNSRPRIRQDYALNLSILLSAGKENNNDPLSNGE